MPTTHDKLKRLEQQGVIDGMSSNAKEIGRLIDFHNDMVDKKHRKKFENDINDRNLYYWKLWRRAIQAMIDGEKPIPRSKPKIII